MKVLWTVNTVPPCVAKKLKITSSHAISWVEAMSDYLSKEDDIELAIVSPGKVKKLFTTKIDNINYYIIPKDCQRIDYWKLIFNDFTPDIIHAYGTEKKHNVLLIEKYGDKIPIVISLQGIISEYIKYYYAGISMKDIWKNTTLGDIILRNGIIGGKMQFKKQIKYERRILRGINYVEGRSDWDEAISKSINPNLKYYYCPRMIRAPFYEKIWNKNSMEKYTILVHQGNYPIKGLHFMIDAMNILRYKYPNVKLYISGNNCFELNTIKEKILKKGYIKYLWKKIKKYKLEENIKFTGYLDSEEMAKLLTNVNVCVIPSAIENAPNALAEAMIVGTPIVASYVGGNAYMLNNGEGGLLYCYDEPQMLAKRIDEVFKQQEISEKISNNAYKISRERHNPKKLVNQIKKIYVKIIQDFKKEGEFDELI